MLFRTRIFVTVVAIVLVSAPAAVTPTSSGRAFVAPAVAAASESLAATGAAAGHDYATDTFSDPWDYSNAEDMLLDVVGPAMTITNARYEGGAARMHFTNNGYVSPLWGGYGSRMSLARDGLKPGNAIDAGRYRAVSFRAWSSRDVAAGLFWFTCPVNRSCGGGMPFTLKAGWNTYVLHPGASSYGWPLSWGGALTGLRLGVSPGAAGSDFALDWFRVYQVNSGSSYTYANPGGYPAEVVWDGDADPSNNQPGQSNWGVIASISASAGSVDLSGLPAGSYRIGVKRSGTVASWTTVSLVAPLPRFVTPNAVGDRDYATTVLHNPWDMNASDDITRISNATAASFAGGRLAATNTSNDPAAYLRVGPAGIDTRVYRNLTITSHYDGPFDLRDIAGGGTMARFQWRRADGGTGQTSDILTYTGVRTLSFDMGLPDDQIVTVSGHNASFSSASPLTALRWDPNEDRGARRWYVDDVQLRSDFATTGSFPIVWQDAAYQPGGTATLIADTDRTGCNGVTVASGVPVQAGSNTTMWNTAGTAKGRYWLCLRITRGAAVVSGYAGGALAVGMNPPGGPSPGDNPVGSWDAANLSGGRLQLAGWAFDPSEPTQQLRVDAYDNRPNGTTGGANLTTRIARPDVTKRYPAAGPNTGYSDTMQLVGPGRHIVCLYAINIGSGSNRSLGCRSVDVAAQTGRSDGASSTSVGILKVGGWAADPSAPTVAQKLVFTVTGPGGTASGTGQTGIARPDVAHAYPWVGPNSGYAATVPTAGAGQNNVCAWIVNVYPPAANRSLGCRAVAVRNAFGSLDLVTISGGRITAAGWAMNPNRPAAAVQVHLYDTGPSSRTVTAGIMANLSRPDVGHVYPGYGPLHGFSASVPTSGAGLHRVCAYAITTDGGDGNVTLGCQNVTVR